LFFDIFKKRQKYRIYTLKNIISNKNSNIFCAKKQKKLHATVFKVL